jgi:hypothetical protein
MSHVKRMFEGIFGKRKIIKISKMMKKIFRSIIGIVSLLGLVQIFNSFIEVYAEDFTFLTSTLNGLVFVISIMGLIIVVKSVDDLLHQNSKERSY